MRVVLDTNVLVSAVFAGGKPRRLLDRCIRGEDVLLASEQTLQEFVEVIRRPKFGLHEDEVHAFLGAVVSVAQTIDVTRRHHVVEADPDDDMFLDVAVAGGADRIVSGDKHLLALKSFQGTPILSVAEALRRT